MTDHSLTCDQLERDAPVELLHPEPLVHVLFHPHLDRWGALTPPAALPRGRAVRLGRATPFVQAWAPGASASLGDPCISRELLELTWTGAAFRVRVLSDRRPVSLHRPDGAVVTEGDATLPPGSRVVVEDRLVLALEHRVHPVAWRAWYRDRHPAVAARDASPDAPLDLVGDSEPMWRLRQALLALPRAAGDVFLHGETGAGKELVAAVAHRVVRGADAPMAVVNCAAIPTHLFESELFGHTVGAFTGAAKEGRRGAFREADGGTLFLDEIAELPLEVQARLNRALEARAVQPVGGPHARPEPVDVLVLYATWRDLPALVAEGRFRLDLLNRCQRLCLEVPSLRDRAGDVPALTRHLLRRLLPVYAGQAAGGRALADLWADPGSLRPPVALDVLRRFVDHGWDEGNVRALYNAVQRAAFAYMAGGAFDPGPLAGGRAAPPERAPRERAPDSIPPEEWRDAYATLGSVRKVAARFGVSVSTADKYLKMAGAQRASET